MNKMNEMMKKKAIELARAGVTRKTMALTLSKYVEFGASYDLYCELIKDYQAFLEWRELAGNVYCIM